jgi:hypothetical protein
MAVVPRSICAEPSDSSAAVSRLPELCAGIHADLRARTGDLWLARRYQNDHVVEVTFAEVLGGRPRRLSDFVSDATFDGEQRSGR